MTLLIGFACAGLITSCAASIFVPAELFDARQAYARASAIPAAQLVPADMHKAREALVRAEKSFRNDANSYRTRDLANLAFREAKTAEALATTASDTAITTKTIETFPSTTTDVVKQR
jgi:hypothetical protein